MADSTLRKVLALLDDALAQKLTSVEAQTSAKILLNSALAQEAIFSAAEVFSKEKLFTWGARGFTNSTGSTLRIEKASGGRLYYQTLLDWFKKPKAGEKLAMQSLPGQLKIERSFARIETNATADNSNLVLTTVPFTGGKLKAGETIFMKVVVDSPCSLPYVMVECPLPSGAEVVESQSQENAVSDSPEGGEQESSITGDWAAQWWSHQDVLDDKIVFFGTTIPKGKSEFHTLLRVELPGTVNVNPVKLEGMYTNMVRSYSQADALSIVGQ
jgi:uncharacterized protein YfaS (alpha-2-macroglobulin family)